MAQKLDEIVAHVFAFDDDELNTIIAALFGAGENDLAMELMEDDCGECDCGCAE